MANLLLTTLTRCHHWENTPQTITMANSCPILFAKDVIHVNWFGAADICHPMIADKDDIHDVC